MTQTRTSIKCSNVPQARRSFARRFMRREDGSMTIFACYLLIIMLFIGGIAVDLMHNEFQRTRLQGVSDRAVLAAADLDQTLDPETVVRDYFAKSELDQFVTGVNISDVNNSRRVQVTSRMDTPTQFMHYLGVDRLPAPASSTATELNRNVEMSLVLDISGSMRFSNRMTDLRPAAREFVDLMLEDGADDFTTINLIPYAGQTNPGPFMFNRMGGARLPVIALDANMGGIPEAESHGILPASVTGGTGPLAGVRYVYPNVSSCIEMSTADFNNRGLPQGNDQVPHYMQWTIAADVMDWGWCPQDQTAIQYHSNDADQLKDTITNMRMHDGTGTHYAMKYAVSLLDPSARNDVSALIGDGQVDPRFAGRPSSYDDETAVKYIVLMTDGQITFQGRPNNPLHPRAPTREISRGGPPSHRLTSAAQNINSFFAQCDLAKNAQPRAVIVYTIAFEAPGAPEQQMRECASSPSHFFAADGDSIASVFEAIARQVKSLSLVN